MLSKMAGLYLRLLANIEFLLANIEFPVKTYTILAKRSQIST